MDLVYFVVLMVFVLLDLVAILLHMPVVSVTVGAFSVIFGAVALGQSANIPFSPYPQVFLVSMAVLVFLSVAYDLRDT